MRHLRGRGSPAYQIRAFLMTAHDTAAYRANAKACADLALEIGDPKTKLLLLTLAESWLRLADYVDHRAPDGTTRPSRADKVGVARPTQQQQQQQQIDSEQDDPEG
jgi:hypothetical protein